MTFEASLQGFDRDLGRADASWRSWRARPKVEHAADPLADFHHVAGLRGYEMLQRIVPIGADAEWKDALLVWLCVMTQRRVAVGLDIDWASAVRAPEVRTVLDSPQQVDWREGWRRVIVSRERAEANAWLAGLADRAPALAPIERQRRERRLEVARRLGLDHPLAKSLGVSIEALRAAAAAVLDSTSDLAASVGREDRARNRSTPSPLDAVFAALARDAPEGWPAHLGLRWLHGLFGKLGVGRALDVRLPSPVGAASFARALGSFGLSLRVTGPVPSLPFALARDPHPVDANRFELLFASLPASPVFQMRALGNVSRVAHAQARVLAKSALFEARAIAVRALLCDPIEIVRHDRFEELTSALLGAPLPRSFSLAWPEARGDEWARLLALVTAVPFVRELVDRFDVDWFANPRATQYLESRSALPARSPTLAADLDLRAGARELARRFEEALA